MQISHGIPSQYEKACYYCAQMHAQGRQSKTGGLNKKQHN